MALVFDSAGSANGGGNPGPSSLTTSFTVVGAGGADFLVGQAGHVEGGSTQTIDSQTYAAVSMTGITAAALTSGFLRVAARNFWLAAPATGANNLVTTWSSNVNSAEHGFQSWVGAHQTTQGGTVANSSGTGTAPSGTVTVDTDGCAIGIVCSGAAGAANVASNDTEAWENANNSEENSVSNSAYNISSGSVTVDWTTTSSIYAASVWPIAPAAGVGANLSGFAVTTNRGITRAAVSRTQAGKSVATSRGILRANVRPPLPGRSVTVSKGTPTTAVAAKLNGFGITTAAGNITTTVPGAVDLVGAAVTATAGAITPAAAVGISGFGATVNAGTVGTAGAATADLIGAAVTAASGTLQTAVSVPLSGHSVSVSRGTLSGLVPLITSLIGHAVTARAGDIAVIGASLEGKSVTVSRGTLTVSSTEIAPVVTPPLVGGGYNPAQGLYERKRTRKEISEARKKYGLDDRYKGEEIVETILEVAKDQAQSLQTEPAKQSEELSFALKIRGIEFDAIYLEALAAERQALIDAEIAIRLQQIEQEEEMLLLMMIAAAACE